LLLDEPTNHLDVDMREALILALQEFPGAVVVVSHDRHLLHTVVDELYLVAHGEVRPFDGDLDDYQRLQIKSAPRPLDTGAEVTADGQGASATDKAPDRQEQKRMQAEFRRQAAPQRKKISAIEKSMAKLEKTLEGLAEQLADPALYTDKPVQDLNKLMKAQGEGKNELQTLEEEWLALQDELEVMTEKFEG
jgi:ATP-binding cassette subfamily F protein 3